MRYLLLILALLGFISPAKAQSSKAEKAIECSAVYLIATAAYGTNKQAANAFMSIQRMFDGVFSANEKQRTNRVITNGMISKKKSEKQMELAEKYDRDPKSVYAIEMQCNAWREKLAPYVINSLGKKPNRKKIQSVFLSAPNIPAMPSSSDPRWPRSKMMVDQSFTAWDKTGRMTKEKVKKKLKDRLKNSSKERGVIDGKVLSCVDMKYTTGSGWKQINFEWVFDGGYTYEWSISKTLPLKIIKTKVYKYISTPTEITIKGYSKNIRTYVDRKTLELFRTFNGKTNRAGKCQVSTPEALENELNAKIRTIKRKMKDNKL